MSRDARQTPRARFAAATVAVALSSTAPVAVRYLAVDPPARAEVAMTAAEGWLRSADPFADLDPAAGDVAQGAAFALAGIRRA